jgi:predicted ATP-grasp superfamily ATP-dependent carboligase
VRHAERVHDVLEGHGLSSPAVYGAAHDAVMHAPGRRLLAKPRRSGGGSGVRQWYSADPLLDGELLQEWVEGVSASLVFVADGHDARTLGVTRQLIGDGAFGATGHRWCGNLLGNTGAPVLDAQDDVIASATAAAQALTRAFGLRGINGIDFIARNGEAVVIEVNPRWTAAVELVERSLGISLFAAHVAASEGALPQVPQPETRGVFGKAVVFAPSDCTIPDTDSWLAHEMIRDIPFPGTLVPSGAPICTVFAAAETAGACYADLSERARCIVQAIA